MTINTLQQLSQLTSTKISINIYSYKTRDVHKQKSYKCYTSNNVIPAHSKSRNSKQCPPSAIVSTIKSTLIACFTCTSGV